MTTDRSTHNLSAHIPPIEHQLRPRRGAIGLVDIIFGPGATAWEIGLALVAGLLGAMTTCWYAAMTKLEWTSLQYAVAAVIAFDIFGGAVANSTLSAKRWFHRPGHGRLAIIAFVAVHMLHFVLVGCLFRSMDWAFVLTTYCLLMAATIIVLGTPGYLQRPVAVFFICFAVAMTSFCFSPTPGFNWFVPLIFIKLSPMVMPLHDAIESFSVDCPVARHDFTKNHGQLQSPSSLQLA